MANLFYSVDVQMSSDYKIVAAEGAPSNYWNAWEKVISASAFLPLVYSVIPASAFRNRALQYRP
jgi:hypothetical protein